MTTYLGFWIGMLSMKDIKAIHPYAKYDKKSGDYHIFTPERRFMGVNFGDEGIVMDLYQLDEDGNDFILGTVGMMYEEWMDWVQGDTSEDDEDGEFYTHDCPNCGGHEKGDGA